MFRYVFCHFLTFNQRVVGSNPAGLTIEIKNIAIATFPNLPN